MRGSGFGVRERWGLGFQRLKPGTHAARAPAAGAAVDARGLRLLELLDRAGRRATAVWAARLAVTARW